MADQGPAVGNAPSSTPADAGGAPRKRRWIKIVLALACVLVIGIGLLIAFAPKIASGLAPGIIHGQAAKSVKGNVAVGSASLSWGGPQRIGPITWTDESGKTVAKLSVESTAGLWGLATGGLDLGTVTISDAEAHITRAKDGTLNTQTLVIAPPAGTQPAKPAAQQPIVLPKGLKVKAILKKLDVTFVDETAPAGAQQIMLNGLSGEANIDPDKPLDVSLSGSAQLASAKPGDITLSIRATNWASADGVVTPSKATVVATARAGSFPVAMLDAIVGPLVHKEDGTAVPLATALGPVLDLTVDASGSLKDATAKLSASLERLGADGDIRIADGVLTDASPFILKVQGAALGDVVPALGKATSKDARTRIAALPDATLTIDKLRLTLPQTGKPMDLRGAAARIQIALTQITGETALTASDPTRPMRIAPLTALIETADLAGQVHVTASTSATLADQPAGDIAVDLTASGLLDAAGAPGHAMPAVAGTAQVRRISTALAQPFVQALNIDMPRDVGPTLDVDLRAASRGASGTDIDITAKAQYLNAQGGFTLTPTQIATKSSDFTISLDRAGGVIGSFMPASTGLRLDVAPADGSGGGASKPAGGMAITLRGFNIPRDAQTGAMHMDQMAGAVSVSLAGMRVSPIGPPGARWGGGAASPLDLTDLQVRAQLTPGKESTLNIDGAGAHAGTPFTIKGNLSVADLWKKAADGTATVSTDIAALKPAGRFQVIDFPATALALLPRSPEPTPATQPPANPPATAPAAPIDIVAAAREVFGDKIGLDFGIKRTDAADTTEFVARVMGIQSNAVARVRLSPTELKGTENFAKLTITPALVDTLLRTASPENAGKIHLAAPAEAQVGLAAFTIPMQGLTPQLDKAAPLHATITVPAVMTMNGLDALVAEGSAMKSLKSAGIEGLTLDADLPFNTFLGDGKAVVNAKFRTRLDANGKLAADLAGTAQANCSHGAPIGPLSGTIDLTNIATAATEVAIGQPGLLTGALGDSATMSLKGTVDQKGGVMTAELTAQAPKLKADGPIAVSINPQSIEVTKAAKWALTLDPAWLNQKLTPAPQPGAQPKAPTLTVTAPVEVGLTIARLVLPRAEGGPAFGVAVGVDIPKFEAISTDKRQATLDNTNITLTTQDPTPHPPGARAAPEDPTLAFQLNIASLRAGDSPAAANVGLKGTVEHLVGPNGALDPSHATITTKGRFPSIPTAIIDVLAGQDGVLVEALGPMVALDLDAQNVPLMPATPGQPGASGGTFKLNASSERATLSAEGDIGEAVFVASKPINVNISELTEALAGRFVKGLPAIGSIQKSKQDRPATIVAENLRVPLSKDMSKLNGVIRIDPGEATFGTSSLFGKLLDLAKIKGTGQIGKRLDPLTVTVTNGVATYPRYILPLGEFSVESEGTVDLAARKVDVVTWVPLGSLTDQAAGLFKGNLGIGGVLGQTPVLDAASMVPFRTKGSFDDPSTGPDLELFAKNILKQLNPGKIIEDGLKDLLKKKEGK